MTSDKNGQTDSTLDEQSGAIGAANPQARESDKRQQLDEGRPLRQDQQGFESSIGGISSPGSQAVDERDHNGSQGSGADETSETAR